MLVSFPVSLVSYNTVLGTYITYGTVKKTEQIDGGGGGGTDFPLI